MTAWTFRPVADIAILIAAVLYLRLASRSPKWAWRRTAWFLLGLSILVLALNGAVGVYAPVLFSMHMAQHLLLITVIPALIVLGQPLELLRRASSPRRRHTLAALRGSPAVAVLTHPLVALAGYTAVLVGTHLTPFMQVMLLHPWLHHVETLLYLGSGYLFLLPLLAHEPLRWRVPYLLRLAILLIGMVVDTVVGVTLLMTTTEPFPAYAAQHRAWGPSLLDDLHWGGAAMWVGGDALMAALAVLVINQWLGDAVRGNDLGQFLNSARRTTLARTGPGAAAQKAIAVSDDVDDDPAALDADNEMLVALAERQPR
ncbi:cytochrome c oxidase assembly protein [Amycolatopsis sp. H20-H5]|uniref:cytochrome c oxidase assembly protein n=1 Tax=Amycolatopsis sp. H20-H5 TaxID=3046309 RepID=UPI002DBF40D5|nr:cytochrome c oxidase assembly protein [Amycolatopsis sp. H20-H5]MEC3975837.1 cytochrome c oxidase assembly protein [Amycolatopsis sp. H20-H5]